MTLSHGREYLAIPGPSVMPDRVLRAMHRAAPNIYEGEMVEMTKGLATDLKHVAGTTGEVAMYISNGHGLWDASLSNTLSRGDQVLVLETGRFAGGWGDVADALGAGVTRIDFGMRAPVDPTRVADALRADADHRFRAVLVVLTDTASTVRNDIRAIRQAMDDANHPALLMVDCMASLGCEPFVMDDLRVDLMTAGSQKGLMTPPGMGFVFFNDRADAARNRADMVTPYWDWRPRVRPELYYHFFCGTAPTHHLFGLREALDMIAEEGLESVWNRHEALARMIWAAAEAWGVGGPMALNIARPQDRSRAVTMLKLGGTNGQALREWVQANTGVTLGIGLGFTPMDGHFRIGHMGHVNAHMVLGVLGSIDAGLKALGIAHGSGALDAAAQIAAG